MAKTTGPLFSMDASGAFGGALVYSRWKGRPTVRQLVTPANPHAAGQETARNRVRVAGKVQNHVNLETGIKSGQTLTDKARLIAGAPAGFAWNGNLVDEMIGTAAVDYNASDTAWLALTGTERTAWDTAAAALTPAYTAVPQTVAGGGAGASKTAGYAFWQHQRALTLALGDAAPTGTPPTYT
ncbi:MAG: hypothetical protein ACREJC_07680 [Tepidisphaeraceae bacterium]